MNICEKFENDIKKEVCRACLIESYEQKSLFQYEMVDSEPLSTSVIISNFTNLRINEDDGLPNTICEICLAEVYRFHKFRQQCLNSDIILRTKIEKENHVKMEVVDEQNVEDVCVKSEDFQEFPEASFNSNYSSEDEKPTMSDPDTSTIVTISHKRKPKSSSVKNKTIKKTNDNSKKLKIKRNITSQILDCRKNAELENNTAMVEKESILSNTEQHSSEGFDINKKLGKKTSKKNKNRKKNSNPDIKYPCHLCSVVCSTLYTYKNHCETHSDTFNYLCNFCGKSFKTKPSYKTHLRLHDPDNELVCKYCDKVWPSKTQLDMHIRVHNKEKPFKCEICGKECSQKSSLKVHMRIHTGEKPFHCKTCGKEFSSASTYAIHKRRHENIRPFKCSICPKSFVKGTEYRIHFRYHTGEKPYKCNVCDKSFVKSWSLKIHGRTHTGEKPYVCEICSKGFAQRHCLKTHICTQKTKLKEDV